MSQDVIHWPFQTSSRFHSCLRSQERKVWCHTSWWPGWRLDVSRTLKRQKLHKCSQAKETCMEVYPQEVLRDSVADTQPCLKPWRSQSSTTVYKVLQLFTSARRLAWKYTQENLWDDVDDVWLGFTPWRDQSYTSIYKHHETCTLKAYTQEVLCAWPHLTPWRGQSYTSVYNYKHHETCTESMYAKVLWNGVAEVRLLLALKWQKLYKCLHTQGDSKSTGRGTSLKQSGQDHKHCFFLNRKNQNARKEQQYNNNYIMTHLRHCPIDLSCTEAILRSFDHFVSSRISP